MDVLVNKAFHSVETTNVIDETNKEKKFNTNLTIDYNNTKRERNYNRLVVESDLSFRSNTVLSWENVNVYNKNRKSFFDFFKRNKQQMITEKQFIHTPQSANVKINHDRDSNELKSNQNNSKRSLETISNGSSYSSKKSSLEVNSRKKYRQILNQVSGSVRSGEFLAIMGGSGAGKTTLINFLTCRNLDYFNTSGRIKLNGKQVNFDELSKTSAYVQQDDLFLGTITVKEHLTFLAMLKMNNSHTRKEIKQRIKEILGEFHLEKCQDTLIGLYNNKKGISGGEKRRLAFASEILTNPTVLFCDEPTSGLDSHMALLVINTLVGLARKGKIIICTIHQPSSQIFNKFDKLCLLAEGRVAYFGPQNAVYEYFQSIKYECPSKYNPADYFIEILALKLNGKSNLKNIHAICDAYDKSALKQKNLNDIHQVDKHYAKKIHLNELPTEKVVVKKYSSPYFTQLIWLLWRQLLNTMRDPMASRILFIQSIIMGIFLGFTYFQLKNDQSSIQNKNGLCFLMLMQACLCYLFGVASHYHDQWSVIVREIDNNVYSVNCYYLAKTLAELPQNIIFPTITVTIIYWLTNLNSDSNVYFLITCVIVMASNTAVAFGSFLAIITPNIDSTVGLIGPMFFPLLLFSGFLINTNSIPVYFIWIKYVSWIFYANESIMIALWRNITNISCTYTTIHTNATASNSTNTTNTNTSPTDRCLQTGLLVLDQLSINQNNLQFDILMVLAFTVFWPTFAGICLYIKSKKNKLKKIFTSKSKNDDFINF